MNILKKYSFYFLIQLTWLLFPFRVNSQVSITPSLPFTHTQDFNTLALSGTSSAVPTGWLFAESGTGSNGTYSTGTGSSATADTYSAGAASSTERAFGTLRSNALAPYVGAYFTNNSGATITELSISYTGEMWRLGTSNQALADRLDFQYSLDATSLLVGTYTDVDALDFNSPVTNTTAAALNGNLAANRTSISHTITGLSIASGSTFYIRWADFNVANNDDLLTVDDFSITANGVAGSTISTSAVSGSPFSLTCSSGSNVNVDFTVTGTFNAGNVFTAQLSNAAGSFTSPVSIGTLTGTTSGTINATIPAGTASGTGYRIRVISNSPVVTGTNNGADLTITYTCNLSTDAISGSPFSTTCSAGAAVNVPFTASSSMGAGNVYTAQLSNATGSFASPVTIGTLTSTAATGTISATIPNTTTAGTGYRIRVISSSPAVTGTDNGTNLTVTFICSISTGAIAGSPFSVSCSAGAAVNVPFTSSSAMAAGNIYTAQLSGPTGSFASPTSIGTLSSTAASGTISATIPTSASAGSAYRIRVVSSAPSITGTDNGTDLIINYTCNALLINEIYIDAIDNDGSPNPALGEWVELYNGTGSAIDISCFSICDGDFCVTFPAGSTIPAGGYFTIGSAAGAGCVSCDFPGATFNVDWGTCGCTSGSTVGTFTNGNEQLILFNSSGGIVDAVIWGGGQSLPTTMSTSGVGACNVTSVTLPTAGGGAYENIGDPADGQSHERISDGSNSWQMTASPTLGSTNNPPLPVELISFTGNATVNGNLLQWITASEINNSFFEIRRSADGVNFEAIGRISGQGTTNRQSDYEYLDESASSISDSYYRLIQFDFDGKFSSSNIIRILPKVNSGFNAFVKDASLIITLEQVAEYDLSLSIVSATGQVIASSVIPAGNKDHTLDAPTVSGMYFISIGTASGSKSRKIVVR